MGIALALLLPLARSVTAQSDSALEIRFHGLLLVNGFRNSTRVNNTDVPTVVLTPDTATRPLPAHSLGATVRQTRIWVTGDVAEFHGASLHGELDTDFFGGQQPSSGGRTHPVLRIRRAFAEARWTGVSLLVGQEAPPLFEINPSSLASSGFPGYSAAGNLWLWLPQLRLTGWVTPHAKVRIGLEGTVMAPSAGEPQDPFLTQPDRAERSGRPAFEGRVVARWGEGSTLGELGAGGHIGWLAIPGDSLVESQALGASARFPLGSFFEIRGEVFKGQALAGLGGGGIGQNLSPLNQAVETSGGWAQLILKPWHQGELGVGYGLDDPDDADLGTGARLRNAAFSVHLLTRVEPVVLGFEYRQIETRYATAGDRRNHHLNLAAGFEF
jgi:hypothetical protein